MIDIYSYINNFFKTAIQAIDVYNEFSLQHEMGIFLRNSISGYKVQFERDLSFFGIYDKLAKGGEIDISIFNAEKTEKYAIELKYQKSGRVPDTMFDCVKDVKFMEELKSHGFTNTFCVALFNEGHSIGKQDGIYKYFRKEHSIYGDVFGQTGSTKNQCISIDGKYDFSWDNIPGRKEKCYVIKI